MVWISIGVTIVVRSNPGICYPDHGNRLNQLFTAVVKAFKIVFDCIAGVCGNILVLNHICILAALLFCKLIF